MATKSPLEWAARFAEAYGDLAQVGRALPFLATRRPQGTHFLWRAQSWASGDLQAYCAEGRVAPCLGAAPFLDCGKRKASKLRSLWLNRKQTCVNWESRRGTLLPLTSWRFSICTHVAGWKRAESACLSWWLTIIRHVRKAWGPYEDLVLTDSPLPSVLHLLLKSTAFRNEAINPLEQMIFFLSRTFSFSLQLEE